MHAINQVKISQAVILAGGLGERLRPFTIKNPKPMYPINGIPFIEYLLKQIKSFGINNIIILLGYLPDKIIKYLGDGKKYDLNIKYYVTPVEYDTQYRIKSAIESLEENFLMMYCDNICPINFEKLVSDYFNNNSLIEVSAYSNDDNYTKSNLRIDNDGKVLVYDKKRTIDGLKGVDIGYAIVSKKVLSYMSENNDNFESVVYPELVREGKLYATITKHRYYSIGSFERIELTKKYLSDKKYIFLDRDGTINVKPKKAEYICKPSDFKWIDGAKEAIKMLNEAGYFVIIISNQAGIARGFMTINDFINVQSKMERELADVGAHIDAVYYCPHDWNENCECRKPKPGMLYKAQKDYSINLTNCVFIGDDERDMETSFNANMKGILVNDEYKLIDAVKDIIHCKNIDDGEKV